MFLKTIRLITFRILLYFFFNFETQMHKQNTGEIIRKYDMARLTCVASKQDTFPQIHFGVEPPSSNKKMTSPWDRIFWYHAMNFLWYHRDITYTHHQDATLNYHILSLYWRHFDIRIYHDYVGSWTSFCDIYEMEWNKWGFRLPLCTYGLNWARRSSWGWWD